MAVPTVRSFTTFADGANATSRTINKPTGATTGDWVYIWVGIDGSAAINTPTGFTSVYERGDIASSVNTALYKRKIDGSEGSTFTISTGNEIACGICVCIAGADGTESLDVFSDMIGSPDLFSTEAYFICPPCYATYPDSLVLRMVASDASVTLTNPGSHTNVSSNVGGNSSGATISMCYQSKTGSGYVDGAVFSTGSASESGVALTVIIRSTATEDAYPDQPFIRCCSLWMVDSVVSNQVVYRTPHGTVANDLLLHFLVTDTNNGSLPSNFTNLYTTANSTAVFTRLDYKIATGTEGITLTGASSATNARIGAMLRIVNADTTTPINAQSSATGTNASPAGATITPSVNNCLILNLFGTDDAEVGWGTGTPSTFSNFLTMSTDKSLNVSFGITRKEQTTAAATGSVTASITSSEEWVAYNLAIAPLVTGASLKKVVSETMNSAEAKNQVRGRRSVVSETQQIAEAKLFLRTMIRRIAETENISEVKVRVRTMVKLLLETENNAESVLKVRAILRLLSESENMAETRSAILGKLKIIADAQNISELTHRNKVIIRLASEVLQLAESINKTRSMFRHRNETLQISEVKSFIRTMVRLRNESVEVSEQIRVLQAKVRRVAETLQASETKYITKGQVRLVAESQQMVDTIVRAQALLRRVNETLQASETRIFNRGLIRRVNEAISLTELFVKYRGSLRLVNEAEQVVETVYRTLALVRRRAETQQLAEAIDSIRGQVRLSGDAMQISEVLLKTKTQIRQVLEALQISEGRVKLQQLCRIMTETERMIENYSSARQRHRYVQETQRVLEQAAHTLQLIRMLSEVENLVEQKSTVKGIVKYISEAQQVAESLLKAIGKVKIISDSLNLIEQNRLTKKMLKVIVETMNIGEGFLKKLVSEGGFVLTSIAKLVGAFFTKKQFQAEYESKKSFSAVYETPAIPMSSGQNVKSVFTGSYKTVSTGGKGDTD